MNNHWSAKPRFVVALMLASVASGCASSGDEAVSAGQPVETPSDLAATTQSSDDYQDCCYGAFTCPSNPAIVHGYTSHLACKDFETPFSPVASSSCKTACGAPCTDSGWSCPL
jgi:hypothetical protein